MAERPLVIPDRNHPFNENPHVFLATYFGHALQFAKEEASPEEIHRENIRVWNTWSKLIEFEINSKDTTSQEFLKNLEDWRTIKREINEIYFKIFGSSFPDNLSFRSDFSGIVFTNDINFSGFNFHGYVDFSNCVFSEKSSFINTTFNDEVNFSNALFKEELSFVNTIFNDEVNFSNTLFKGESHFDNCLFSDKIFFTKSKFETPSSFANTVFLNYFPNLSGIIIDNKTNFSGSSWPKKIKHGNLRTTIESAALLRHIMSDQGLRDQEHFFFRKEMHCIYRNNYFPILSSYYWFETLSDFGNSILRPTLWLSLLWAIGCLIFWFDSHCTADWIGRMDIWYDKHCADKIWSYGPDDWKVFAQSFSNLFPYLGFQKVFLKDYMNNASGTIAAFTMFQTLMGTLLLFLIGLGIRTRFRLR